MSKTPYLFRRNNIFYFRLRVPSKYRESLKLREIFQSLKTENRNEATKLAFVLAAHYKANVFNKKTSDTGSSHELMIQKLIHTQNKTHPQPTKSTSPLLSVVIQDFLNRYDKNNKATFIKLKSVLPIFIELLGDKFIDQILQADLNLFFDDIQQLPVRRDAKIFKGMLIREMIKANSGKCIAQGTFDTYRACISLLINWASVNYKDQGFPDLSIKGVNYRGDRGDGINKQRAIKHEELQTLFGHPKMEKYSKNPDTAHYCWLPLIGLYTGCRINEVCQLNPFTDILQDKETGIHYLSFTDEGETADGVDKSIKTNSSKRIVPIHSKLIELGFLNYVESIKKADKKILFPQWEPRGGKASANASKWFNRYLESVGLRDEKEGARLSGFHSFRHTFITHAMQNKIQGVFEITGHESGIVEGFGKISDVAKGYWTRGITEGIAEKKAIIEKFEFDVKHISVSH